ncbi:MAG TPA: serine/threonine-protein kinase [Polyangiaceae bacterium]|jgi:serine/threonine-protein kinase
MELAAELVARIDARVGSVLNGKYRLDALLGVGGMASVFAATHRNGSRVAIKLLHEELAQMESVRARFLLEGYAANRVGHPGAVRVLDDDDVRGENGVFLVMELLDGETLEDHASRRGGVLPVDPLLDIARELLEVLSSAHSNGVVHRDVKPANVFLVRDGGVKVLDFGIARLLEGTSGTASGALMGTPDFMAPEQAAGRARDIDPRTDIWSVGALLFYLLSGRPVHEGSGPLQLVQAAMTPPRSLGAVVPSMDPAVIGFVDRALAFEKGVRWPGARAMLAGLAELRTRRASQPPGARPPA